MQRVPLSLLFGLLLLCFSSAFAQDVLQLTCEHTIPPNQDLVVYMTFENTGKEPVTILTVMPDTHARISYPDVYLTFDAACPEAADAKAYPDVSLLVPVKILPGQKVRLVHRQNIQKNLNSSKLKGIDIADWKIHVTFQIGQGEAAAYKTWSGSLSVDSSYKPFLPVKKEAL